MTREEQDARPEGKSNRPKRKRKYASAILEGIEETQSEGKTASVLDDESRAGAGSCVKQLEESVEDSGEGPLPANEEAPEQEE